MKKKFGIVSAAAPNVVMFENDSITDQMRDFLKKNLASLVQRRKGGRFEFVSQSQLIKANPTRVF